MTKIAQATNATAVMVFAQVTKTIEKIPKECCELLKVLRYILSKYIFEGIIIQMLFSQMILVKVLAQVDKHVSMENAQVLEFTTRYERHRHLILL